MKSKKSQIQSQIFIYVFALIVISLILVFGIKAILSFKKDTDKVSVVNFQTDLNTKISQVAAEYGSIEKVEILLPTGFKQVCFTDENTSSGYISYDYPLISDSLVTGANVYLVKDVNDVEQFKTQTKIIVNDAEFHKKHFLCVDNTKGKIIFTLKGMSRYAEISP